MCRNQYRKQYTVMRHNTAIGGPSIHDVLSIPCSINSGYCEFPGNNLFPVTPSKPSSPGVCRSFTSPIRPASFPSCLSLLCPLMLLFRLRRRYSHVLTHLLLMPAGDNAFSTSSSPSPFIISFPESFLYPLPERPAWEYQGARKLVCVDWLRKN